MEWNRNRHNTYKDNREAEIRFIPKVGAVTAASSSTTVEPGSEHTWNVKRPYVYSVFRLLHEGTHTVVNGIHKGKIRKCSNWSCSLPGCEAAHMDQILVPSLIVNVVNAPLLLT
jgi:hypothetical protein